MLNKKNAPEAESSFAYVVTRRPRSRHLGERHVAPIAAEPDWEKQRLRMEEADERGEGVNVDIDFWQSRRSAAIDNVTAQECNLASVACRRWLAARQ